MNDHVENIGARARRRSPAAQRPRPSPGRPTPNRTDHVSTTGSGISRLHHDGEAMPKQSWRLTSRSGRRFRMSAPEALARDLLAFLAGLR
jgi:hypothetical protein